MSLAKELEDNYYGTTAYHKLSLYPVLATDGVLAFCEGAKAFWLFDDMSAFIYSKDGKNEPFIVVKTDYKNKKIRFENGNKELLLEREYYTMDLDEDFKFFISNYPMQKVIMLPSEY